MVFNKPEGPQGDIALRFSTRSYNCPRNWFLTSSSVNSLDSSTWNLVPVLELEGDLGVVGREWGWEELKLKLCTSTSCRSVGGEGRTTASSLSHTNCQLQGISSRIMD